MRDLTIQDYGTYNCGVDKASGIDIYTPVELKVKKGSLVSREVTAYAGGGINIKCRYEDEYKDKPKSFCSASTPGRRSVKDTGNNQGVPLDACEYEEIKDTRRLSASDAGTFTVYSTAELPTIPSDHHTVYANSDLPTSPCDSALYSTAQLPTIPSDQDIYSNAQLPTRLSAGESAEDLNYTTVPLDACEYEEIKDTRRLSASDAGTFTVYSTAELPTIPSDHHTVYANSDLPTSPCDSALYSTAHLPTIPSDQDIYSNVQLPTRLSAGNLLKI
ncbi:hypothetical protein KOW79_009606 [Hemibagrus wyckioides]|uniref:Uncharacterized protein n=1 Tax=Hemibagrus wyckioides TaxID=337641 RepID=A0A9D3NSC0_9TELE|nr:hypothetical protein KOW79_009606 [Hemibagrus wyckioides]